MSLRSFFVALCGAALAGTVLCGALYGMRVQQIHAIERQIADLKRERVPLQKFVDEIRDFVQKKEELQKRIDAINQLKQNQMVPNWQFAVIAESVEQRGVRIDEAELTERLAMRVIADDPVDLDGARAAIEKMWIYEKTVAFDSPPGDANWRIHLEGKSK